MSTGQCQAFHDWRFGCISNKSYNFQDVSEDTDDMYDELLNNYGKVVYKKKDQKPASEEIDDDSESLSCKLMRSFLYYSAYTLFTSGFFVIVFVQQLYIQTCSLSVCMNLLKRKREESYFCVSITI